MSRELVDVDVQFISLVKKGANKEKVTIYKSDDFVDPQEGEQTTIQKFYTVMKNFFGGKETVFKETVSKAKDINIGVDYSSFTSQITSVRSGFSRALYILDDVIYSIFWDDSIENGKELIAKNIDEFKAYVMDILNKDQKVKKEFFTKESTPPKGDSDTTKIDKEVDEVEITKEDIVALLEPITKSVQDLTDKVELVEKSLSDKTEELGQKTEEVVQKTEEVAQKTEAVAQKTEEVVQKTDEATGEVKETFVKMLEEIKKSVDGIGERVSKIEEFRGETSQLDPTQVEKSDDPWAGVLFRD